MHAVIKFKVNKKINYYEFKLKGKINKAVPDTYSNFLHVINYWSNKKLVIRIAW